jgi:phosphocarrier protein
MKKFDYIITDENGIHARPAGMLVSEAKKYASRITLSGNGKSAQATRLMAVMSLGIKHGQTVSVEMEGPDEEAACEAMQSFFASHL